MIAEGFRLAQLVLLAGAVASLAALVANFLRASAAVFTFGIAFVPVYWYQPLGGSTLVPTVAVLSGALLLPAAVLRYARGFRPTSVDLAAVLLVVSMCFTLPHFDHPATVLIGFTFNILAVYLAYRLLLRDPEMRRLVAWTIVVAALVSSLFAISESQTGSNWFLTARTPGYLAREWAVSYTRLGEPRAAANFGHPIALGLFLATAAVLLQGLLAGQRSRGTWAFRIGSTIVLVLGVVATASRLALLLAVFSFLFYATRRRASAALQRLAPPLVILMLASAVTPQGQRVLVLFSSTDSRIVDSAQYRSTLFDVIGLDQFRSLTGVVRGDPYNLPRFAGSNGSIDNEYLLRYLQYGALGLLAFALLGLAAFHARSRATTELDRAWTSTTAVTALAYLAVAALLQQNTFYFIALAGCAAVAEGARASSNQPVDLPPPQHRGEGPGVTELKTGKDEAVSLS